MATACAGGICKTRLSAQAMSPTLDVLLCTRGKAYSGFQINAGQVKTGHTPPWRYLALTPPSPEGRGGIGAS